MKPWFQHLKPDFFPLKYGFCSASKNPVFPPKPPAETGIGSQQLLTYSQMQIQHCIVGQIVCVRKLLLGKLRSDLRQKINEATAKRDKVAREGKFAAIKSITGQR